MFTKNSSSVTNIKLSLIASGDLETVKKRVTTPNEWLDDRDLDTFLEVLRNNSTLDILTVLSLVLTTFFEEVQNETDVQIIGGNLTQHWRCYYYNDRQLLIFESLFADLTYDQLSNEEKLFIKVRYPKLSPKDVKSELVVKQPDCSSCGIYAATFATSLVLGTDPRTKRYSGNANTMRHHFVKIISSKVVSFFPDE